MSAIKNKTIRRILCLLAAFLLVFASFSTPTQAAVPGLTASVTRKNVLSLAKKYDTDGYYLLKNGEKNDALGFMRFFTGGPIITGIDTAVHEMCHANTHAVYGYREKIYKGKKKFITMDFSNKMNLLFYSKSMASSIPKKYRTFRFKTYISNAQPNLTANMFGCYGLLDEFTAYCWGMHNTVSLFPYYKAKAKSDFSYWTTFINLGANDRLAYAEFRYYILHYLAYAKANHPKTYQAVMRDASFKKAFQTIDKKFRANIEAYENDLQKLLKILNSSGQNAMIRGDYFYSGYNGYYSGPSMFTSDYNKLMKQMKKGKYKGTSYASIYKKVMK